MTVDERPVIGPTVQFKTLPFWGRRGGSAVKSVVALVRTRVWFSVPTWQHSICTSSSKGSTAFSWPLWAPGLYMVHIHARKQNTYHIR